MERSHHTTGITSPCESSAFLKTLTDFWPYRVLSVLFLDNRHRRLVYEETFRGTLNGALTHPCEVFRLALELSTQRPPSSRPQPPERCRQSFDR